MKKLLLVILLIICGIGGYIYYYLDSMVHDATEKYASKALGVAVTVDYVIFKILDGRFALKGVQIKNPKGFESTNIIKIDKVDVSLDMRTLFKDIIKINFIKIDAPILNYEIGPNGDNLKNLKAGINKTGSAPSGNKEKSDSKKIIIYKFFLNDTEVVAAVQSVAKKSIVLPDIYIQNIGKDSNGISVANASDQVIRELMKVLSQVNLKLLLEEFKNLPNNVDGIKETLKGKREDIKNQIEGEISNFLGKKK